MDLRGQSERDGGRKIVFRNVRCDGISTRYPGSVHVGAREKCIRVMRMNSGGTAGVELLSQRIWGKSFFVFL